MDDTEWMRILDVLAEHPEGMTWEEMCTALGWSVSKLRNLFYYVWGVHAFVRPAWPPESNHMEETATWTLNDYGRAELRRPIQGRLF